MSVGCFWIKEGAQMRMWKCCIVAVLVFAACLLVAVACTCSAQQPRVLWKKNLRDECGVKNVPGVVYWLNPVIADVSGDSVPELVIALSCSGNNWLMAVDAGDGSILSRFALSAKVFASFAVLGDTTGGIGKVAAGPLDGYVYVYDIHSGRLLTKMNNESRILALAVADVNDDGLTDYVVQSDNGVSAYDGKTGGRLWRLASDKIKSNVNIVIDDVDMDGRKEVVVADNDKLVVAEAKTGAAKWSYDSETRGIMGLHGRNAVAAVGMAKEADRRVLVAGTTFGDVMVLDGSTGKVLKHKKELAGYITSLSTGDLNGDGIFDVVVASIDHKLYALSGKDLKQLWNFKTGDEMYSSPALGDMDNDGLLDVVIAGNDDRIYCIDGEKGDLIWKYDVGTDCESGYAVLGDVNSDGFVEVGMNGIRNGEFVLLATAAKCTQNEILWAKARGNNRNTCAYGER